METRDDCQAYVVHLRCEHRRLRDAVRLIEQKWSVAQTHPTVDATKNRYDALRALRVELASHFTEEEQGGCIEEAVARLPNLGQKADRLEQEHKTLLAELDAIIAAEDPQAELSSDIRRRFDQFSSKLHQHETTESKLLEQAFGSQVEY